jgi:hypothetical protein
MIRANIKQGEIKYVRNYEAKNKDLTILTYIVRDTESEKSKGSMVCVQFIDGKNVTPLKKGDTVTVTGSLNEKLKKDADGKFLKDEKGHLISDGFELVIDTIKAIEPAKKEPPKFNPDDLPFELTPEQKAALLK